jgi:hypothetical protein
MEHKMPETLTLEEAMQLASQMPQNNFNPFGATSFEDMVKEAKKLQEQEVIDVCVQEQR